MADNLIDFQIWLSNGKRRPRTIRKIITNIHTVLTRLRSIDRESLFLYIQQEYNSGKKANYLNSVIECITLYTRYLGNEVRVPKFPKNEVLKTIMTDEEIEMFYSLPCPIHKRKRANGQTHYCKNDEVGWNRMSVFWAIAAYTGMRMGEIAALTPSMIDVQQKAFILPAGITKTAKQRIIPITSRLYPIIIEYLKAVEGNLLFPPRRGSTSNFGLLNSTQWSYSFSIRLKILGIKRAGLTPYSIRHTFASSLLPDNSLFDVMSILGHTQPQTTMQYYHNNLRTLTSVINRLPLNVVRPEHKLRLLKEFVMKLNLDMQEFETTMSDTEVIVKIVSSTTH